MAEAELPEGWVYAHISDVAFKGEQRKPFDDETFTYIDIGSIDRQLKKILKPQKIVGKNAPSRARKVINEGDVLVSLTRPNLNAVALVPKQYDGQIASTGFEVIKTITVDSRYVFALTRSNHFVDTISGVVQGALYPAAKSSDVQSYEFPLPPLAEQKVIADKLDTLLKQAESTKAHLERIPDVLKRFRKSVLFAAVTGKLTDDWRKENVNISLSVQDYYKEIKKFNLKANGLPAPDKSGAWLSCKLGHIFTVKSGDGLTAKEMAPEGKIPVYGGNGINGYHDKSNIASRAIVIGRVGFYCGSVHFTEEQAWVTDNALIVSYPESLISKEFAYWLLSATNLREDSASSAQPVISGTKIYPINILLPPLEEQTKIVQRVEQLFAYADNVERQVQTALARVNNLTRSILAKAFRGGLTADWRTANPDLISGVNSAEALLAKIKVEREVLAKQLKKGESSVKKKTGKTMSKQIIQMVAALKAAGKPLSGQELLAAAGYPSDSSTEQLEQFFLDLRRALGAKQIVKQSRDPHGQDWFALAE